MQKEKLHLPDLKSIHRSSVVLWVQLEFIDGLASKFARDRKDLDFGTIVHEEEGAKQFLHYLNLICVENNFPPRTVAHLLEYTANIPHLSDVLVDLALEELEKLTEKTPELREARDDIRLGYSHLIQPKPECR